MYPHSSLCALVDYPHLKSEENLYKKDIEFTHLKGIRRVKSACFGVKGLWYTFQFLIKYLAYEFLNCFPLAIAVLSEYFRIPLDHRTKAWLDRITRTNLPQLENCHVWTEHFLPSCFDPKNVSIIVCAVRVILNCYIQLPIPIQGLKESARTNLIALSVKCSSLWVASLINLNIQTDSIHAKLFG